MVAGVLLAAGSSTRMGFDKMWATLGDQPIVARSIRVFAASPAIDHLVIAVAAGMEARMMALLAELHIEAVVVAGGARRQDSVQAALRACERARWVVVHDAARALVTPDLIELGIHEARETGAAIAAVPVTDTIKVVAEREIVTTPERDTLWAAQTPQVFRRDLLLEAHGRAKGTASDDAALLEAIGVTVKVYPGSYGNIKITTPVDLHLAATLLAAPRALPHETMRREDDDDGAVSENFVHGTLSGGYRP
jgi:2-C-methyl-D-erythritol 4-phosphate cytidylyltransferase